MNEYTRSVFIQSYKNALLHARTGNEIQDIYNGMQTMAADFDAPVRNNVPKPQRGCDCDDCMIAKLSPPLSGMLSAALFISNFQVGGIGR